MIFCFGSNLAGRHGKGAALEAVKRHGAMYGEGVGRQGNSYAIPTKDAYLRTIPVEGIRPYMVDFFDHARENPDDEFNLTPIGTGLAGHSKVDIIRMIRELDIPDNVYFNRRWFRE